MPTDPAKLLALFQASICEGIPDALPPTRPLDPSVPHAPKRKDILSPEEKKLSPSAGSPSSGPCEPKFVSFPPDFEAKTLPEDRITIC